MTAPVDDYIDLITYPLPEDWMDDPEHVVAMKEAFPVAVERNRTLLSQALTRAYADGLRKAAEVARDVAKQSPDLPGLDRVATAIEAAAQKHTENG